jgi:ATP-binding cassette subfamily B protein
MVKLLRKYLKPFLAGLILVIILLFGQAACDLSLPDFMSGIVNVGIQQSGVEHAAPDAISDRGMALMKRFMSDDEAALVDEHYVNIAFLSNVTDIEKYRSQFPNAESSFYILKDSAKSPIDKLDDAFGMAAAAMISLASNGAGQFAGRNLTEGASSFDLTRIYQMTPMLDLIPASMIASAREAAASFMELMRAQSGIMFARAFYLELGADLGGMQSGYILRIGVIMLLIALAGGIATVLVNYISTKIASGMARRLRRDIFEKVESFSQGEFDKFSTASLITRCTNDVMSMQMLIMMGIRMICYAPIMGIGGIIMAVSKSPSMSWIIAAAVVLILGFIAIVVAIAMPKFKIIQKLVDKLNLVSRESLSGLMVIRAFGAQNHEKARFNEANRELTDTNLFINRVIAFMMPFMTLVMSGISLVVIWVGAHGIASSAMQVGDMMAFIQYMMQIMMSFMMIAMMFIIVPRAMVSGERIGEVLGVELSIRDPLSPKPFNDAKKGVVEFRNVHFRYNDAEEDAVSAISFTAKPGETTAIIGSTGSGKSTIVSLLLRFFDVSRGEVIVGGVDVRQVRQAGLRAKIGYVPQQGVLLSGTIASNLRYGKEDATDEEIETAASVAQAMEFIGEKPDRFNSEIAQGGSNVSGGQKQRLSIARALAKDPEILVFDDSFSALDFKTDAALRRALKQHAKDATIIVIAQRVGTIMNADHIIVMENGKIAGAGAHAQLLKSCPEYYEIASSQLSKEELA